jgi:hypothetical protein
MIKVWTDAAEAGILERIEPAIADTSKELHAYFKAHTEFTEIGNRMLQQWEQGVALSLKAACAVGRAGSRYEDWEVDHPRPLVFRLAGLHPRGHRSAAVSSSVREAGARAQC